MDVGYVEPLGLMAMLRRSDYRLCHSLGGFKSQCFDAMLGRLVIADLAAKTMAAANDVLFGLQGPRCALQNIIQT